jgi:hypothetical protein
MKGIIFGSTVGTESKKFYIDPNDEWKAAKENKVLIHKEAQSPEHELFMKHIVTDPEFKAMLKERKEKLDRMQLLASRPIPSAV